MERMTMTSDKGGVAFTFNLDITCEKTEIQKILKLAQRLKAYEDTGLEPRKIEELKVRGEIQKMYKPNPNIYCCPACGEKIVPMWDYCPWCGQHVTDSQY